MHLQLFYYSFQLNKSKKYYQKQELGNFMLNAVATARGREAFGFYFRFGKNAMGVSESDWKEKAGRRADDVLSKRL